MSNMSRREFVKTTALSASAVALSAGVSRGFPANEKVRLGWIGSGHRGKQLLNALKASGANAEVAVLCDLIQDRINEGTAIVAPDKPTGYNDFRVMLDKEKLDGIVIATPPNAHAEVAVPVLNAGFNTFCEKPVDITVAKCDAVTKAARASKGIFQIGTQRRCAPIYRKMMEAIWAGMHGKTMMMQGGWHWSQDPSRHKPDRDGGRLIEQASHHMDVMSWAMKDVAPVRCVAMGYSYKGAKPSEFSETESFTTFEFPGGVLFNYSHLWLLPGKFDEEVLRCYGEKGCMDFNKSVYIGRDEKEQRFGEPIAKEWNLGTDEEMAHFVDCIKTGNRTPWANIETGRICSLMCIMGRMAMVNAKKDVYEPSVVTWKDLGSTTDL